MTTLADVLRAVAEDVRSGADELNRLDGAAGDGDLGVTMSTAAGAVLAALGELGDAAPGQTLAQCGARIAREAPSTSGTLVATGLLAAGRASGAPGGASFAGLLEAARAAIAARGKAEPGEKTMLDAPAPAVQAAADAEAAGAKLDDVVEAAAEAARAGAAATAQMQAKHGRAGWLAERSAGHEDAGARLVALILTSAAGALAPARAGG